MAGVAVMIGWVLAGFSLAGTFYTIAAAVTLWRFYRRAEQPAPGTAGITLVKPLHGAEPRLVDNLASFLDQDWRGPIQLLCGVQRPDDPAIGAVEALRRRYPQARIDLVIDATPHGANRKVANLINLQPHIAHDVIVLSDSDMVAPRTYLSGIMAALDRPGTGAVTLPYNGRGDAGAWSRLGAAGLSWQFLPGAVFGAVHGLAQPCMGSTIALRRGTLDRIGGFARVADVLADDHAIGAAVAALGLAVVVAPVLVTHASAEPGFGALWRHEIRWGATVRDLAPVGYILGVIAMPLPLAFPAILAHSALGPVALVTALLARTGLALVADRIGGARSAPLWTLPLRDVLTFMVFCASLTARSVDWRGSILRLQAHGRVSAKAEFPGS
jgi:ceramide glucosyltransferase